MEVKGRKVKMSIWVRHSFLSSAKKGKERELHTWLCRTQRARNGSAPSRHRTIVVRRGSSSVCSSLLLLSSVLIAHAVDDYHPPARPLARPVYDVSNRESFEALPRWLSELEIYVSPEVVKIVVGNKLDKVRHPLSRLRSAQRLLD